MDMQCDICSKFWPLNEVVKDVDNMGWCVECRKKYFGFIQFENKEPTNGPDSKSGS